MAANTMPGTIPEDFDYEGFIADKLDEYDKEDGSVLWAYLNEDLEKWVLNDYLALKKGTIKKIVRYLREHGVYVEWYDTDGEACPALMKAMEKEHNWTPEDIEFYCGPKIDTDSKSLHKKWKRLREEKAARKVSLDAVATPKSTRIRKSTSVIPEYQGHQYGRETYRPDEDVSYPHLPRTSNFTSRRATRTTLVDPYTGKPAASRGLAAPHDRGIRESMASFGFQDIDEADAFEGALENSSPSAGRDVRKGDEKRGRQRHASNPPSDPGSDDEGGDGGGGNRGNGRSERSNRHNRARDDTIDQDDISGPIHPYGKDIANFNKFYNGQHDKYGSESDHFALKFTTFLGHVERSGLPRAAARFAFPIMLKDLALDFYNTEVHGVYHQLDSMAITVRDYFEDDNYRRRVLQEWNALSLEGLKIENPDKSTSECFKILSSKMQNLRYGLPKSLRDDDTYLNKMVLACEASEECAIACNIPHAKVPALVQSLKSGIAQFEAQNGKRKTEQFSSNTNTDIEQTVQYYVDRKFFDQSKRGGNFFRGGYHRGGGFRGGASTSVVTGQGSFRGGRGGRGGGASSLQRKRGPCFVCQDPLCWSTNHPQSEIDTAKTTFKNSVMSDGKINQYILDLEGDHQDEDEEGEQQARPDLAHQFIMEYEQADCFFALVDQAETHALTGFVPGDEQIDAAIPYPEDEQSSAAYAAMSSRYDDATFRGLLIDSGAAKISTGGKQQFEAYQAAHGNVILNTTPANGATNVTFGIGKTLTLGTATIRSPIGDIEFHIVSANTPFLLSIADMDRLRWELSNIDNVLRNYDTKKEVPVVRQWGHAFLMWGETYNRFIKSSMMQNPCYLTTAEITRIHRRFGHPSVDRLHNLLQRAGHESTKGVIEELTKFCDFCQKHGKSPGRFKFRMPDENIQFNHSLVVDIFYLDGKPVLHVIDEATRFTAGRFLKEMSAKHAWDMLRLCWIDCYLGPPDQIVHDAGTNFHSKEFRGNASAMAIKTKCVPVEAHWSVGLVERSHATVRRAYDIIREELKGPNCPSEEICLQMAFKACNDSSGPEGLVPTLLVFGAFPRMSWQDAPTANMQQRANAIKKAMAEIVKVRAKQQVNLALHTRNGPDTTKVHELALESEVLVYREKTGWEGPFRLKGITGETCHIQLPDKITDFRSTVVRPYFRDHDADENKQEEIDEPAVEVRRSERLRTLYPPPKLSNLRVELPAEAGLREVRFPENYTSNETPICESFLQHASEADICIYITEPSFVDSRQKEIDGLLDMGVFEFINLDDVPEHARIFKSRFVDTIKNEGTDTAFEKSRLVIQAWGDTGKDSVLTMSPTIQRASQRIILCIAPMLIARGFYVWLRDITQAYIQSKTELQRDFYTKPPKEIADKLGPKICMHVIKPCYGVPESGNHWFNTYQGFFINTLGMKISTFDPCLMSCGNPNDDTFAVLGLQVDDTFFVSEAKFAAAEEAELKKAGFKAKEREKLTTETPLKFNGGLVRLLEDGSITLTQEKQVAHLETVSLTKTKSATNSHGEIREGLRPTEQFSSQRARGAYIATVCQPEASHDYSFAAQGWSIGGEAKAFKLLNKRLKWQKENAARGLRFVQLKGKLRIICFCDASYAGNDDNSSQMGFVVVIADEYDNCNIAHYASLKCKRVTRSVLASELYGMAHGFDYAAVIKSTLDAMLGEKIPLIIATDSNSLYGCLVKLGTTTEKRLMVDVMCLRQSYERRFITEILWIEGGANPADAMTKSDCNGALRELIDTNKLKLRTNKWVERNDVKE